MKKVLPLVILITLIISLAGCGAANSSGTASNSDHSADKPEVVPETEAEVDTIEVSLTNDSEYSFFSGNISPSESNEWGGDVFGGSTLSNGASIQAENIVTSSSNTYDVRLFDQSNNNYWIFSNIKFNEEDSLIISVSEDFYPQLSVRDSSFAGYVTSNAGGGSDGSAGIVTGTTVVSINATYSGATGEGIVLDASNPGIVVTGISETGYESTISGWTIDEPQTLIADQSSIVIISYQDLTCELEVTCSTVSPQGYKDSCASIPYNDLARTPDAYIGQNITFYGQILQVLEDGNNLTLRVGTRGSYGYYYDDVIMVSYTYSPGEARFLEDDMIRLYGVSGGLYTYESIFGESITVPVVYAEYIDLA